MKNIVYICIAIPFLNAYKKHNDGTRNDNEIWLHNQIVEAYQTTISKGTTITFINKDPKHTQRDSLMKNFIQETFNPMQASHILLTILATMPFIVTLTIQCSVK